MSIIHDKAGHIPYDYVHLNIKVCHHNQMVQNASIKKSSLEITEITLDINFM